VSVKKLLCFSIVVSQLLASAPCVRAGNASQPLAEPVLEPSTLHCVGLYWLIQGDDNKNAQVEVHFRMPGQEWRQGMNLFRVEKGGNQLQRGQSKVHVPPEGWLFAGSLFSLEPNTEYELRLNLQDPDGGSAERILLAKTMAEPVAPPNMATLHVTVGSGGGAGSAADPFRGLQSAQKNAKPGDILLVHKGIYKGTFEVTKSGEPGRPIIWRGAGDGEVVIDAQGSAGKPPERAISASDVHDVWFEKLTIRNANWGLVGHMSQRMVVRRCHFHHVQRGITAVRNTDGRLGGFFIADNTLEGPFQWSDALHGAQVDECRGIELSGSGHVVCYNRVRNFKDGIDLFPGPLCVASDIHNNEISESLDDGIEMDGSERNTRCYLNRLCNVFQGISVQPVYGGPIYVLRNVLYNVQMEVFKMHNSPSGALFYHNTAVKKGAPLFVWTNAKIRNCVSRNNLLVGTASNYAIEFSPRMVDCDFDYDCFVGGPWPWFLKWNGGRYQTVEEARAKAPVYRHAIHLNSPGLFASGLNVPEDPTKQYDSILIDLRPRAGVGLEAGEFLPSLNHGKTPAIGAYEPGVQLPHYGPRPE
jgi:hypothetical protein